jgi:hypothetical protein
VVPLFDTIDVTQRAGKTNGGEQVNPAVKRKAQEKAQKSTRKMVDREVTAILKGRGKGPQSDVEDSFIRAIYAPDRRLG